MVCYINLVPPRQEVLGLWFSFFLLFSFQFGKSDYTSSTLLTFMSVDCHHQDKDVTFTNGWSPLQKLLQLLLSLTGTLPLQWKFIITFITPAQLASDRQITSPHSLTNGAPRFAFTITPKVQMMGPCLCQQRHVSNCTKGRRKIRKDCVGTLVQ